MELFWRDTLTCPTEEEFVDMVNNSTLSLVNIEYALILSKHFFIFIIFIYLQRHVGSFVLLSN